MAEPETVLRWCPRCNPEGVTREIRGEGLIRVVKEMCDYHSPKGDTEDP